MAHIYVKYEHYITFIKKYQTNKLNENVKLLITTKMNKDLFRPMYTKFEIENKTHSEFSIIFSTKDGNKYKLNVVSVVEKDKNLEMINHLSFSVYDNINNEYLFYDKLLTNSDVIEILNRIKYILKSLINNGILDNSFCIGGSDIERQNTIYEYILYAIAEGDYIEKLPTLLYSNEFGLYFKV